MNAARVLIVSVALAVAVLGCSSRTVVKAGGQKSSPPVVVVKDSKGGPPPHAPAHGYRHKHAKDNVVLTYDSGIAVYIVSGHKDCYFNDGVYFRYSKSSWGMSAQIGGPWKVAVVDRDVPSGLKVKYAGKSSKSKSKKAK